MTKYLIINADDCGLAPGVNRAIIDLHQAGVVKSTSLMVNMPGFQDAARRLVNIPTLGVGLHLNLSSGSPISPASWVPSLVDGEGGFSEELDWNERDIMIELKAQMNRLLTAGIRPTHIDSHRFTQDRKTVCRPMILLARSMKLPMRRTGWEPALDMRLPPGVDNFYAHAYFEDGGKNLLLENLRSLPHGTSELICHPGYVDECLESVCTWTQVREIEFGVLSDPEVLETIRALEIRLINYNHLHYSIDLRNRNRIVY
ncbi:carbohydrate deacetylase [Syntrophomonas curvata]